MTIYERKAPKPRRGVGSVAATRKWRMAKDLAEMKEARVQREKTAAREYVNRRKQAEHAIQMDGREWGRQVAFQALDAVVTVARVADKLPDVPLVLSCKDQVKTTAFTDFKSVHIVIKDGDPTWQDMLASSPDLLPSREDPKEVLAEKIATIKGMAYHEIGHIKYTVRPWDLFAADGPQESKKYHRVWNILEDQRMESWYVKHNPRLANMFTIMVSNLILDKAIPAGPAPRPNHWILLAGREYLPLEVQGAAYNESPWEEREREEWYRIVQEYKRARTRVDMRVAIHKAWEFLNDNADMILPDGGIDEHTMMPGDGDASQVSPDLGEEQEGDDKGDSPGKRAGKDADLKVTDQSLLDAVLKAKREAVDEFAQRSDVQTAVSRVAEQHEGTFLPPPPDRLCSPMNPDVLAQAEALGEGMKQALSSFMTATDPYWETRKEHGILDALAYRTRDVGSRDFRRHRVDFDGKGRNVHVSLLCDISGSMAGAPMLALSMALYGTARACEDLGIENTMILWSTVYHQIWGDGNIAPVVWNSCGGTDPVPALDTIEEHNATEADNHLVLVFTDGAWYTQAPLTTWGGPGRKIVVLHYGSYTNSQQLGADEEIHIDNVTDIPELLAQYIGDLIIGDD